MGQFHRSISQLVRANATHTLAYLLTEARQIAERCEAPEWQRCSRCTLRQQCRVFTEAFQPDERRIIE